MRAPPAGWPRISSSVFYEEPRKAIDWLVRVFGFEARLVVEGDGGRIEHSELTYGEGLIMVCSAGKTAPSPKSLGGANTQHLCVYVDDVDAHYARSKAAGTKITRELKTSDYGADYWADRNYGAEDPEGHIWYFMQRVRNRGE